MLNTFINFYFIKPWSWYLVVIFYNQSRGVRMLFVMMSALLLYRGTLGGLFWLYIFLCLELNNGEINYLFHSLILLHFDGTSKEIWSYQLMWILILLVNVFEFGGDAFVEFYRMKLWRWRVCCFILPQRGWLVVISRTCVCDVMRRFSCIL